MHRVCRNPPIFQSTLPARGATDAQRKWALGGKISIHAPRTGSDTSRMSKLRRLGSISIHAPRTGSDLNQAGQPGGKRRFQSTLPARGATRFQIKRRARPGDFNPRSPHGERHLGKHDWLKTRAFQSTLPARGATGGHRDGAAARPYFNPRSPHGERQRKVTILSIRIIGFAQKVYHKTVLLRISLAENAVILPEKPRNPVRTSLQKAGGLRFARAIRAARPYSISSPSGA